MKDRPKYRPAATGSQHVRLLSKRKIASDVISIATEVQQSLVRGSARPDRNERCRCKPCPGLPIRLGSRREAAAALNMIPLHGRTTRGSHLARLGTSLPTVRRPVPGLPIRFRSRIEAAAALSMIPLHGRHIDETRHDAASGCPITQRRRVSAGPSWGGGSGKCNHRGFAPSNPDAPVLLPRNRPPVRLP